MVLVFFDVEVCEIWVYWILLVLGVLLVVFVCFWGGSWLIGCEVVFVGFVMFVVIVLLGIEGGIVKIDVMLVGCMILVMVVLMNVCSGEIVGWCIVFIFWFVIGLGMLIKGFVMFMVVGLVVVVFFVWECKFIWLKLFVVWWGLILVIGMVLFWLISI